MKNMTVTKENITEKITDAYNGLKKKYNYNIIEEIPVITETLQNNPTQQIIKQSAEQLQRINNILFQRYGDANEIIIFQARINQLRYLYDVPDDTELVVEDPETHETFAQ